MANGHGGKRPGAGRPIGSHNKVTNDIAQLARSYVPAAVVELGRLMLHAESESARVAAIKEIFDRAYGKSVQALQALDEHGNPTNAAAPVRVTIELVGDPAPPPRELSNRPGLNDVARRNVQLIG
jgi:hypothetical protein